jgi:hypothetical protein
VRCRRRCRRKARAANAPLVIPGTFVSCSPTNAPQKTHDERADESASYNRHLKTRPNLVDKLVRKLCIYCECATFLYTRKIAITWVLTCVGVAPGESYHGTRKCRDRFPSLIGACGRRGGMQDQFSETREKAGFGRQVPPSWRWRCPTPREGGWHGPYSRKEPGPWTVRKSRPPLNGGERIYPLAGVLLGLRSPQGPRDPGAARLKGGRGSRPDATELVSAANGTGTGRGRPRRRRRQLRRAGAGMSGAGLRPGRPGRRWRSAGVTPLGGTRRRYRDRDREHRWGNTRTRRR